MRELYSNALYAPVVEEPVPRYACSRFEELVAVAVRSTATRENKRQLFDSLVSHIVRGNSRGSPTGLNLDKCIEISSPLKTCSRIRSREFRSESNEFRKTR